MGSLLLITEDPCRSAGLACDLDFTACTIQDLYADKLPIESADAFVVDVVDLGPDVVNRLRRVLAQARQGVPLVVLLHRNNPRDRLQAIALGATRTLSAPFDPRLIQAALSASVTWSQPVPVRVRHQAEEAWRFYGTVFVPDRPITPVVIDNGTDLVERAIRESGIRDWIRAVRAFDDSTHQHCLLVAGLAAAFAASLGLGPAEQHRLTRAALLHDVGKIHVPTAILNKPGRLDPDELALVRRHPEQGAAMLSGQGFEPDVIAVARSHHEMLDGSGYPDGLTGDAVPDLVRLVTVCDIYGALIERRSYKPPMAAGKAYTILSEMKGRLDPVLVDAFTPVMTAFTLPIHKLSDERRPCTSP